MEDAVATREGRWYDGCALKSEWSCTCEAYTFVHKVCSYVIAAFIPGASLNWTFPVGIEVPDLSTRWCGFCGSTDCTHVEYRTLKRMAECKDDNYNQIHRHQRVSVGGAQTEMPKSRRQ